MGAAAWVTSRGGDTRKVRPGAAVRDTGRDDRRGPAARVMLWQVELLWRHRIIDYLLLRAARPG